MAKPSQLPEWASGNEAVITPEPNVGKKRTGWISGERPTFQAFNWWMRRVWEWCVYLDGITNETLTWAAKHTFGAGIDSASNVTLTAGHVYLTGGSNQAVYKQGSGRLVLGTDTGNASDVLIQRAGVDAALFNSSGMDNLGRYIGNVHDPLSAQDADTLGARESAISAHNATYVGSHGATTTATASRMVLRDGNGRAQVEHPAANNDIDTLLARNNAIEGHNTTGGAHGATSSATILSVMRRDPYGRSKVAAPAASDDIDTLGARNTALDLVDLSGSITAGTGWTFYGATRGYTAHFAKIATVRFFAERNAGGASWANIMTLPAELRPAASEWVGAYISGDGTASIQTLYVDAGTGVVSIQNPVGSLPGLTSQGSVRACASWRTAA